MKVSRVSKCQGCRWQADVRRVTRWPRHAAAGPPRRVGCRVRCPPGSQENWLTPRAGVASSTDTRAAAATPTARWADGLSDGLSHSAGERPGHSDDVTGSAHPCWTFCMGGRCQRSPTATAPRAAAEGACARTQPSSSLIFLRLTRGGRLHGAGRPSGTRSDTRGAPAAAARASRRQPPHFAGGCCGRGARRGE